MAATKSQTVSVETLERNPRHWLERLLAGQTLTLVNSEGIPVAIMVSLHPPTSDTETSLSWEAQWDDLARKISRAWKSDKGAVEILTEMR